MLFTLPKRKFGLKSGSVLISRQLSLACVGEEKDENIGDRKIKEWAGVDGPRAEEQLYLLEAFQKTFT